MKYIFIENGKINGCGEAQCIGNNVINCEVSDEVYNTFQNDKLKYIYQNNEIIENPNYEADLQAKENEKRVAEILEELDELDKKRIRAICEDEPKDERSGETWLDYYNRQIYELREELKSLGQ